MFAFENKDLSTNFILSQELERIEKDFYKFESNPDEGFCYTYDNEKMLLVDMDYLNGYADVNNNSLLSTNTLAKLLFHKDIKETKTIKPLSNLEIEKIVKKLVNHQVHLYKGLDKESYVFFHNLAKEEILSILTSETEEEALEIIKNSLLFNDQEKKAAEVVKNNKDKYLQSHLSHTIVEEALKNKIKVNGTVSIREGIFEKRYRLNPVAVIQYIGILIKKAAKMEKVALIDPERVSVETLDEIDKTRKAIFEVLSLDDENTLFLRDNKKYVKFLYAKEVLKEVLGATKIEEVDVSIIEENWDRYNILGFIKMFIENIDMNIVTYTYLKKDLHPVVKKLIEKRIKKVYQKIKNLPLNEAKRQLKKFGYKEVTTYSLYKIGKKIKV